MEIGYEASKLNNLLSCLISLSFWFLERLQHDVMLPGQHDPRENAYDRWNESHSDTCHRYLFYVLGIRGRTQCRVHEYENSRDRAEQPYVRAFISRERHVICGVYHPSSDSAGVYLPADMRGICCGDYVNQGDHPDHYFCDNA